jgi:thioredoxin reductase (NADPH)
VTQFNLHGIEKYKIHEMQEEFAMQGINRYVRLLGVISWFLIVPGCINSADKGEASYDINAARTVKNLIPVAIIGSGPAGLSAAIYTCRANLKTVVIAGEEPGGQLMKTTYVENVPGIKRLLGSDVVAGMRDQAIKFGASIMPGAVVHIDVTRWPFMITLHGGQELCAMSIIIAAGAQPRFLGVPGEQHYWGHGVSACAVCDAPFYQDDEVVVVGGGDAALEEAMHIANYAKKVTILVRKDHFRASAIMQDHLMKGFKNIQVLFNVEVTEIVGDGVLVTGVQLKNTKTGNISKYPTSGVFLGIGRVPNTQFLPHEIETDQEGHIKLKGRSQETSVPGVFAAGDVADPVYRQAGVAAGDGIKAALDTERFLNNLGLTREMIQELESQFVGMAQTDSSNETLESLHSLADLEKVLAESKTPVVLDFYTEHCPSCLQLMPKLARAAHESEGKVVVYKVNAENLFEVAKKYNILKVPSLVVIKQGKEVARYVGDDASVDFASINGVQVLLKRIAQF